MENEKDRFGDTMRLVERAKEDIYFAERDREVLEKLRGQLRKVETVAAPRSCPKCPGRLEGYTFEGFALDRCHECGGVWLDRGELEAIVQKNPSRPTGRLVGHAGGENLIARNVSMRPAPKKYNTLYKKGHVERDMYLPRLDPKGVIQCSGCGAFHYRRHWTLTPPAGFSGQIHSQLFFCPACRKIHDRFPGGELTLRGVEAGERGGVARILRNEESRAREKNPLERIMRMDAANGGWRVETTTEKLAQRLGRSIKKARGGKLAYKWGHNNKFVRVIWENSVAGAAK